MSDEIKIHRKRLDRSGYSFRFTVKRGQEVLGEFTGNQLDPKGMSIGAAERAALALKAKLEAERGDA